MVSIPFRIKAFLKRLLSNICREVFRDALGVVFNKLITCRLVLRFVKKARGVFRVKGRGKRKRLAI